MTTEQELLNELDQGALTSANKLLPSLDAAVYKHVILGLVFLKDVSDAFDEWQEELRRGGERRSPLPDFYIGAHAAVRGMTLLTRDSSRYRSYFPGLDLVSP